MSVDSFNIRGYLAVITGAADGIGKAIAIKLALEGCNVALIDINKEKLNNISKSLKALFPKLKIYPFICDVSNKKEIDSLPNKVKESFNTNSIQILINNAGVGLPAFVLDGNINMLHKTMNINVWGLIYGTRAFKSMLLSNIKTNKQCYIINTGSIASLQTANDMYSITKHAVIAFSETITNEFKKNYPKLNVLVSTLVPGFVQTSLLQRQLILAQQFSPKYASMIKQTKINDPMIVAKKVYEAMKDRKTVIPTHLNWHNAVIKDRMNALLTCSEDKKINMRKAMKQTIAKL